MAYQPKINKPLTIIGSKIKNIIIPNTKSSCLPEDNFPPKMSTAK